MFHEAALYINTLANIGFSVYFICYFIDSNHELFMSIQHGIALCLRRGSPLARAKCSHTAELSVHTILIEPKSLTQFGR